MRMLFAATSSHPMIVLEFRHVSMRLCFRAGEVDHAAHAVAAIVRQQGFKEACVVGHSFGTFVASRLCQLHPSLVQSLVSHLAFQPHTLCLSSHFSLPFNCTLITFHSFGTFVASRLCQLHPSLVQSLVSHLAFQPHTLCLSSHFSLPFNCTLITFHSFGTFVASRLCQLASRELSSHRPLWHA